MANKADILNRLQQYEVQPPPEVFHSLFHRLQAESVQPEEAKWQGMLQGLQQLEIPPPSFMPAAIADAIAGKPLFSFLQDVAVAPPADAFERIVRAISTDSLAVKAPIRKLFTPLRAIAAALLLVAAGWGIYRFAVQSPDKPSVELAGQTTPQPTPVIDSVHQTAAHPDSVIARFQLYDNVKTENYFKNNRFTAEGVSMQLVDNDFFVTFASYQYEELPSFLTEEENSELTIRLDQFSYFTISRNMMDMLKKMYQRKSKGTLTRKARKEKEKLERWKKADGARFDQKRAANPLDPIDLAEFLFKY